ncbi:MAG: hypothetical protein EOM00_15365, partial [Clostridia bacterium]|nr:hypothetical protein [Clostridia bacterium]
MRKHGLKRIIMLSLAVIFISSVSVYAAPVTADSEANLVEAARAMRSGGSVQLNFKDMEIAKF